MRAHLVNCTYCASRQVLQGPKNQQVELCRLTHRKIPHPRSPGRFCEQFHQEGHTCESCWSE